MAKISWPVKIGSGTWSGFEEEPSTLSIAKLAFEFEPLFFTLSTKVLCFNTVYFVIPLMMSTCWAPYFSVFE
jgi:hypothetical protein